MLVIGMTLFLLTIFFKTSISLVTVRTPKFSHGWMGKPINTQALRDPLLKMGSNQLNIGLSKVQAMKSLPINHRQHTSFSHLSSMIFDSNYILLPKQLILINTIIDKSKLNNDFLLNVVLSLSELFFIEERASNWLT